MFTPRSGPTLTLHSVLLDAYRSMWTRAREVDAPVLSPTWGKLATYHHDLI